MTAERWESVVIYFEYGRNGNIKMQKIFNWCNEQFGENSWTNSGELWGDSKPSEIRYHPDPRTLYIKFYFNNEEYRTIFILKWC